MSMLKAKLENLDGLDEALKPLYTERDGAYHLAVEGLVDKSKLDEFRTTNTKLKSDLEQLTDKYGQVDLSRYAELVQADQDNKDKKLIEAGKVDELLEERTKRMREEYDKKVQGLESQNATHVRQLEGLIIDNSVRAAATQSGVQPTAVDDVLLRARSVYSLQDGKATPKDAKGEVIYGKDGSSPMAIDEWVKGLEETAGHLFVKSSGGGPKNQGGTPSDGKNLSPLEKVSQGLRANA